jgi:hypothetical protein
MIVGRKKGFRYHNEKTAAKIWVTPKHHEFTTYINGWEHSINDQPSKTIYLKDNKEYLIYSWLYHGEQHRLTGPYFQAYEDGVLDRELYAIERQIFNKENFGNAVKAYIKSRYFDGKRK